MEHKVGKQTVDGFYFEDAGLAAKAEKEAETVRYIRSRTDFSQISTVYGIYAKLVENNVFSTAIGYAFLAELYRILQESGMYNESEIPKIYFSKDMQNPGVQKEAEETTAEDEARIVEAVRKRTQTLNDTSKTQVRNIREMYQDKLKTYKMVIAALALCIIGMLAMLYFGDSSPLRDAEQQVLDKYSAWQESLQEWENELEERENRLSGQ